MIHCILNNTNFIRRLTFAAIMSENAWRDIVDGNESLDLPK